MENSEEQERIQFENEIKKAKLMAEKGAHFSDFSNLPSELESQWLDQIQAFEDAYQNNKTIKIKAFLDNPVLKEPSGLSDEEIAVEFDKIMKLMASNNLFLSTICEVERREMYRFVVEELMEEEIDDVRLSGWNTNFIYEEFHPNHEYDIKQDIEGFLTTLFERKKEYCDMSLAKELVSHTGEKLNADETKAILINFIDSIDGANLRQLEFGKNVIEEEKAFQEVYMKYDITLEASGEVVEYEGKGIFNFVHRYGYYCINGINIPGLKL